MPLVLGGIAAFALSALMLQKSPSCEATLVLNMQPSEETPSFSGEFLGRSPFNPATIIAQSHVERLLSQPIAQATLGKQTRETGAEPAAPGLVSNAQLWLWKTWARLNHGE